MRESLMPIARKTRMGPRRMKRIQSILLTRTAAFAMSSSLISKLRSSLQIRRLNELLSSVDIRCIVDIVERQNVNI